METHLLPIIIVRCVALQFVLLGTLIAICLTAAKVFGYLSPSPDQNLDSQYYVVENAGIAVVAVAAIVFCYTVAAILFFGANTFSRWLTP